MIIMTISNWRRKLRIVLILILLTLIGGSILMLLQMGEPEQGARNDRDANGSLKVEAVPSSEGEEVDQGLWSKFMETLKSYYQE